MSKRYGSRTCFVRMCTVNSVSHSLDECWERMDWSKKRMGVGLSLANNSLEISGILLLLLPHHAMTICYSHPPAEILRLRIHRILMRYGCSSHRREECGCRMCG